MNNKVITNFGIISLCIAGYSLFSIKSQVTDLNYQLNEITKQINEERNNINILKAEYSYLQSPNRLAGLVNKYLGLTSITSEQIVKDPLLIDEDEFKNKTASLGSTTSPSRVIKKVSWRYKRPKSYGADNIKNISKKGGL